MALRLSILFGILCLACVHVFAQTDTTSLPPKAREADSLAFNNKFFKENQTAKVRKALKFKFGRKNDSKKMAALKDSIPGGGKIDSLKSKVQQPANTVTTWKGKVNHRVDSTRQIINAPVNKVTGKVTSVEHKLNSTADSLLNKFNKPITDVEKKVTNAYDSVANKANKTIQQFTQPMGLKTDQIPGVDKELTNIPQLNTKDLNASQVIPKTDVTQKIESELKQPQLPKVEGMDKVQDLKNMPKKELSDLKSNEKLQDLTGKMSSVDSKLANVEKLEDETKKAIKGDVSEIKQAPQELEKQLASRATGVKEGQQYMSKFEQQKAMLEKYKDRKLAEQELRNKTRSLANDKVNINTPQVKKADESLKKTRKKFGSFQDIKDLPKRPPNEMKGKPFGQRFVPGVTFAFFTLDNKKLFDVALQAGYKLNSRFVVGLGGVYRVAINKSYKYYVNGYGLYGGRTFGEFRLVKGFMAHLDLEYLYLDKRFYPSENNANGRVLQSNVGVGKTFNITKRIRGSALGLYRWEMDGSIPGQPKFTMRVGFELMPKKARHKNNPFK